VESLSQETIEVFCRVRILVLFSAVWLALFVSPGAAKPPVSEGYLVKWVKRRVAAMQPLPAEKRIDEIGWAVDIRQAVQLAKTHQRPVFLFTHSGRINLGRC
jgi:hypothetical protein